MSYGDPSNLLFMRDGIPPAPWWESPDISLPGDEAVVGTQTVTVIGRKRPGTMSASQVRVEAYIANPGLQLNPPKPGNVPFTRKIGQVDIPVSSLDAAGPTTGVTAPIAPALVIPATTANPDDAFGIGHRCLIARIYPKGFIPPTSTFTPDVEEHEVQNNLYVVLVASNAAADAGGAGQGGAGARGQKRIGLNEDGLFEFRLDTTTRTSRAEQVTLRAIWVNAHPAAELRRLLPILRETRGFRGLARQRPRKFAFRIKIPEKDLPHRKGQRPYFPTLLRVKDRSSVQEGDPQYDSIIRLQPNKIARVGFTADLVNSRVGLAHVFHLEQIGPNRRRHGGATLIFIRVG
jgi:hypothetical protein